MQKRKHIEIKKKESQKDYLEELNLAQPPAKTSYVRKSFLISEDLEEKIKEYIYKRRTQGDIYYTQTHLVREALTQFLT